MSSSPSYEKMSRDQLMEWLRELETRRDIGGGGRDAEHLLHELQVHQIELEMQNRELREAQVALEQSRAEYAELYDQAPIAYCTLDAKGIIQSINSTGAAFLERRREYLRGRPLGSVVSFRPARVFLDHLRV